MCIGCDLSLRCDQRATRWTDELGNENVEEAVAEPEILEAFSDDILKYEEIEEYMQKVRENRVNIEDDWDDDAKLLNFTSRIRDSKIKSEIPTQ
eukprot:762859-Hanusia_phi.AAC.1